MTINSLSDLRNALKNRGDFSEEDFAKEEKGSKLPEQTENAYSKEKISTYLNNVYKAERALSTFLNRTVYSEFISRGMFAGVSETTDRNKQLSGSDKELLSKDATYWFVLDEKGQTSRINRPANTWSFELSTNRKNKQLHTNRNEYIGENKDLRTLGSFMKFSRDLSFRDPNVLTDAFACIYIDDANCKNASELTPEIINKITVMVISPDDIFNMLHENGVSDQQLYNDAIQKSKEFAEFFNEHKNDPQYADEINRRRREPVGGDAFIYKDRNGISHNNCYYSFSYGKGESKDPNKVIYGDPVSIVIHRSLLEQLPHTRVFEYDVREKEPFKEKDIKLRAWDKDGNALIKPKLPFTKREPEPELSVAELKRENKTHFQSDNINKDINRE